MKISLILIFTTCLFSFPILAKTAWAAIPRGEPGSSESLCYNLWWKDNTHLNCTQKSFCGAYLYQGLETFDTQEGCQGNVSVPWHQKILLYVQNLFWRFFPPSQNTNGNAPATEQPVYNCGGFMGTPCPSGYKCKILGGDAGTCVKSGLFGF